MSQAARGQLAQSKPRVREGGRPKAGRGGESCGSGESICLVPSTDLSHGEYGMGKTSRPANYDRAAITQ